MQSFPYELGDLQRVQGRWPEAEASLGEAARQNTLFWGDASPLTLRARAMRGSVLGELGRLTEAESLLRRAIDAQTAVLGEPHPDIARSWGFLGRVLMRAGRWDDALETIATIQKAMIIHEEGRTARRPRVLTDERG